MAGPTSKYSIAVRSSFKILVCPVKEANAVVDEIIHTIEVQHIV